MSKILEKLNPAQREAVTHEIGPLLIIAGPGSGKTRTVVRSIAYAIENGVQPDRILAFSFTGKACEDLKKQVKEIIVDEEKANLVQISTFHSFCRWVLKEDIEKLRKDYTRNFKVLKSKEQERLVNEQIAKVRAQINIRFSQHHKFLNTKDILDFITRCKLHFIPPPEAREHVPNSEMSPEISRAYVKIYERYELVLETNGWIDYANQLLLANELLRDVPEVKKEWQEKFELIFVDEYQDTDPVQYCIVTTLADHHQNLRVVGDDDQGIYSFRGADIQNILNFEKDYSTTAKVIPLGQNYRSTQRIVEASRALAEFNPDRREKELFTRNSEGKHIMHLRCENANVEANTIADFIYRATKSGWEPRDFVILCRSTKLQSPVFEEAFTNSRIPFHVIRKSSEDMSANKVFIMTIHISKGLEFPNVFVAGVCKDLLPFTGNQENEERRLLYVAMTRAQNWLCLSSYESNSGLYANGRSPFLDEIPRNFLEPTQFLSDSHFPLKPIESNGAGSSTVIEESLDSITLSPIRPEIVLGIDPGKIDANNPNVGWAVTEKSSNGYTIIDCDTETPKGTSDEKLKKIENQINGLIASYSPDAIAVERLEGATDRGLIGVAGCVALVRSITDQHGIEYASYSPQQVKYAATGNRNALKEQVQEGVKRRCNFSIVQNIDNIDDHSADAIAISLCYLDSYLNSSRLQRKKRKQEYYKSGFVNLSSGQFDAAVIAFTEATNIDPIYTEAHYGLGRAHLAQGALEAAENAAKTAVRLAENNHPDSQKLLDAIDCYHSGRNAVNNKQFNEAITKFQASIHLEPFFITAHYERSRIHLRLGNLQVAKHVVEEALKLADGCPPIQRLLDVIELYNAGINFLNARRYNNAIDKFKETIDREPTFTEAHYSLGCAYFQSGALEAAEQSANNTLELNINHQQARALLDEIKKAYVDKGYEALERLDLTEAEKYRNKALQIDEYCQAAHKLFESIKHTHYKQACDSLNNKQYDHAISEFNKLINKDPDFIDAYCGLGRAYLKKGNLREANNYAKKALKLDENYEPALQIRESITQAYYNQGCEYLDNQRYNEAIIEFNTILNRDSNFIDAYYGLSRAYLGKGSLREANNYAKKALKLDENYEPALQIRESITQNYCELARDYLNQDDLAAAKNCANEALKLDENYESALELQEDIKQAYFNTSFNCITHGAYTDAVKFLREAEEIDSNDKHIYTNLGNVYYWLDDHDNAAMCCQKVTAIDPNDKYAYINLGNAYYRMGAYESAV